GTNRERVALVNGNGRYLAVSGTSTALVTASKEQAAAEARLQWIPSTTDGKTFSLVSASAERVLDVNGQGTTDGTTV
ncbi:RICIN domain-containing protein, partial [Rhizobium johnstonii]